MVSSDFRYNDGFEVTPEVLNAFKENGYIILRSALNKKEMKTVREALEDADGIKKHCYPVDDGHGRNTMMCLWKHPGNDITGMISRSEKIAGTMEKLLGGEVYHYHTKLMMKEAQTGGQFVWHQDYGYWYQNGCLYPNMGSVFIAIDKCEKENGCLQIVPKSHTLGRVDHGLVGNMQGACLERVEFAKKHLGLMYVELDPGDALFFHSNVLHTSSPNNSDKRRWVLVIAYNRADNDPVIEHHLPNYTPLHKVPNSAILTCPDVLDIDDKAFMHPSHVKTLTNQPLNNKS